MIKRIISLILSLVLIASLLAVVPVSANTADFTFSLLANGKSTATIKPDEYVDITLVVSKNDNSTSFDLCSMQDIVLYDPEYLELVSAKGYQNGGTQYISTLQGTNDSGTFIQFSRNSETSTQVALPFVAATIRFKALKEGSTTVQNSKTKLTCAGVTQTVAVTDTVINIAYEMKTLTFVSNGGTEFEPVTVKEGTNIRFDNYIPTKAGYHFEGWYFNQEFTHGIFGGIVLEEDTTLYAKWAEACTITFVTNGGSAREPVTVGKGREIDFDIFVIRKDGYLFEGWYADSSLSQQITCITVNSDITVYAKWVVDPVPIYTLTFETNGGSEIRPGKYYEGSKIYLTSYVPTRDNHEFDGWHSDSQLKNEITYVTLNADTTVYAKWLKYCTLTFDSGEGASIIEPMVRLENTDIYLQLADYKPTRENYIFAGWYLEKTYETRAFSVYLKDDTTVYAKWIPASCTVGVYTTTGDTTQGTVQINGGTMSAGTEISLRGGYRASINAKAAEGYRFVRWDISYTPEKNVVATDTNRSTSPQVYQDVYFFAVFEKITTSTMSGTITGFLDTTDSVTIKLLVDGESLYETTVTGNSSNFSFAEVAPGTYTIKISKPNHVTFEESITIANADITKNVKICPKGDVNNNGDISTIDYTLSNSHARKKSTLTGYKLKCADVVGTDGTVTTADAMRINSHAKKASYLW